MKAQELVRLEPAIFVPQLLALPIGLVGPLIAALVAIVEEAPDDRGEKRERALIALVALHDRLLGWVRRERLKIETTHSRRGDREH